MTEPTVYRFLPWARRGLAAAIPGGQPDNTPTPGRAKVDIDVVVAGAGSIQTSATLHGPGDVIGLDPTVIVRVLPRRNATNVEPNYLAAVDFDQPELPWIFTPTGAPSTGRLRPWLVLVVVRDRPGVSVTLPTGAVLPRLEIESGADKELPDLNDSWAWAHVQMLNADASGDTEGLGAGLADHPDSNVSRLVCPRRLEPGGRWIACLVPAFDAGMVRGLGGTPAKDAPLKPAWSGPDNIVLPVYHHWEFQTGPEGDFESLARRLKPYEASANVGRVRMHIGDSSPLLKMPPGSPERFINMDGALQAPAIARSTAQPPVPDPSLDQVPATMQTGLREITRLLADAADGKLDGQAPGDTDALGPPVYAGAHAKRTSVQDGDPTWFVELNTDPRARVAAGLGAEVMRRNQEDVVAACWQQVGQVLETEAALSRARLSLEIGRRFHERHLLTMPPARLLQFAGPLAGRTKLGDLTLKSAVLATSLPNQITDGAMRRYVAPTGRVLAGVARRSATAALRKSSRRAGDRLVTSLAGGREDIDATRFPVAAIDGLQEAAPRAGNDGLVDLQKFGLHTKVEAAAARVLGKSSAALRAEPDVGSVESMTPRTDIRNTGILTEAHLDAARDAADAQMAARLEAAGPGRTPSLVEVLEVNSAGVMDTAFDLAPARGGSAGFLIDVGLGINVLPLSVASGGRVVLHSTGRTSIPVARLDRRLGGSAADIGAAIGALPANSLSPFVFNRRGAVTGSGAEVLIRPGAVGGELAIEPIGPVTPNAGANVTFTMPPLVTDSASVARFETAMKAIADLTGFGVDPPAQSLVAFPLNAAADAMITRSNPVTAHPKRLDTVIRVAGHGLLALMADPALAPSWRIPVRLDRVMAYPELGLPAYTYLAAYDRTRFCPGVDEVPPDSITVLETNPRFIAAFMAGINDETAHELMWRGFPSDGRGTPWRHFWKRLDGAPDIEQMHLWGPRPIGTRVQDSLPAQTTDPLGNLVLLLRGDLLRRYPRATVIAIRAETDRKPSANPIDLRVPVFAGQFDPDVSFFGFPLTSADLTDGAGWFFALMEPVTEPRFGFDETIDSTRGATPTNWSDAAWPDLGTLPGGELRWADLAALQIAPGVGQADAVANALFQRPFELLVHSKYLVKGI